ncbi:MAG: phosphoenolpyruvate carboxykinase (GTP) [Acidobacteria bacterium]|nr:phosphoenolpyruvate carboxykinase (GTP) [Acidobacteriota bacterium]
MMSGMNSAIRSWVGEIEALTMPSAVVYCDGSNDEKDRLVAECLVTGELIELNQQKLPGCYLHRSAPHDVARTEQLTFICTTHQDDTGPTNNWMAPDAARDKLTPLFRGSMKGRTMFVVPFLMGPPGSPYSKVGVEITDSRYVVLNMRIMTRVGKPALDELGDSPDFARCLHSLGDLSPDRRFIVHFPEENTVWSIGSGYGGNALLGKKCMALRLASYQARKEGWLAEHMLILGCRQDAGPVRYVAAAFPSACGKTNLAMIMPPAAMPNWKTWTVGDDIAWIRPGKDGRLWAVNPEFGFFGVLPGTSHDTNPTAFDMIRHDTIFTNAALRPDGTPWWEGHDDPPPPTATDWQGWPWTPDSPEKATHPNARFTTPAVNCASLSPEFDNPSGVPLDAIMFGARRRERTPLVYESRDWQHGVFLGATLASETTAAASGKVGVLRRDPMAMLAFCGYNMGDYFQHWLDIADAVKSPPRVFRVNWFRTDERGAFLWPGFSDNLRVIKWILARCDGTGKGKETPIGIVPTEDAIDRRGLDVSSDVLEALCRVEPGDWAEASADQRAFFTSLGPRVPKEMLDEQRRLAQALR